MLGKKRQFSIPFGCGIAATKHVKSKIADVSIASPTCFFRALRTLRLKFLPQGTQSPTKISRGRKGRKEMKKQRELFTRF